MAGEWECKQCGKINVGFIGTCECGGLREDGIQTNLYKREEKRKWQCPECLKINDRDYCSCGYVWNDACGYWVEGDAAKHNSISKKNKQRKAAIIILAVAVVLLLLVEKIFFPSYKFGIFNSHLDSIVLNSNLSNGAAINTSLSDAIKIIGVKTGLGGISRASSGWNINDITSKTTEYIITNNNESFAASITVDSDDRVVFVAFAKMKYIVGDTEIRQFSEAFAEIAGATPDSVENILKHLYKKSKDERQVRLYNKGICLSVISQDGYYTFSMCAVTMEKFFKGYEIGK